MKNIWGVTAYFNPTGYATKLRNLEIFAKGVRAQGLKLMVVELAFGDGPFSVPRELSDCVVQLRSGSVLWQKERLLNVAMERLPADCEKVAWLDGDILFSNANWVEETSRLLENQKVVQPYQLAAWLPQGATRQIEGQQLYSMPGVAFAMRHGAEYANQLLFRPDLVHPGFGWAARAGVLRAHGLYDKFILGGGDFITMLAMYSGSAALRNQSAARCLCRHQVSDATAWMDRFHATVGGDVGYAGGTVFHLWHGDLGNRQYLERYETLRECEFDPAADIALDHGGCWEWSSDKPDLHRRVKEYFASRREDG